MHRIDALQYANWSETVFRQMREGGVHAMHATIAYHETFREAVANIEAWNRRFAAHSDLIFPGRTAADVRRARAEGRTAIFFGFQTPQPIEDDLGLLEIWHALGIRFVQLSYNAQSLLATGWTEAEDPGLTRLGRAAVAEMNRLGIVVDMSHSAERSTLDAIERSTRPIAVTHANPSAWHPTARNKSDRVLAALAETGGMLGFSLYPHHLAGGSDCTLEGFCAMVARTAERMGPERIGIGSDLCQDQPDRVVQWMRGGRWAADDPNVRFPPQPAWFRDNRDWPGLETGLRGVGFSAGEIAGILGENWLAFFERSFGPAAPERGARQTG
ncbi:MAG: membrane dipeptidase [Paracoccaceae bacterium]